jgi:hypothetical protein
MGWQDDPVVAQAATGGSWKDDPVVAAPSTQAAPAAPEAPTDVGRQVALGGRAVGEGVLGTLADIPGTNPVSLLTRAVTGSSPEQLGTSVFNKIAGTHLSMPGSYTDFLSRILTRLGAPTPDTPGEQLGSAAIRGASGALALGGIGGVSTVPNAIRAGVSGATGAGASEIARQQGAGPWGQVLAGLVGGFAPGAAEQGVRLVGAIPNAISPLTRGGQQSIAGRVLANQATDPQAAAAILDRAQPIVPNSPRNAGEASQDLGLLALEKGLRSRNTPEFGQRVSEQNAARQAQLASVAGTPEQLTAAKVARDAATGPMREAALGTGGTADVAPVHATIDSILQSPAGARETVSKSLEWAKGLIGDHTDPASLYEIRKDLQLAQQGKLQPSSQNAPNASTLAQARGQLGQVVSSLDDSIEAAAPGFKAYLERYKDLSKPIDQMKVIQEIQKRSQLQSMDITTGDQFLGNAKFGQVLDKAIEKSGQKLTPEQIQRMNAIRTDLQYGQAINSPLVKAPGSDTFQNLSIAQAIGMGGTSAHPIAQVLTKPLGWMYKLAGTDKSINDVLAQAMLDPKLASAMLKRATPASVGSFSGRLRASALGVSAGLSATTPAASVP